MEVIYLTHESEWEDVDHQVMAIGFFDGVHLGHQALLKKTKEIADQLGTKSAAFTFSPHPDEVIKGEINRSYLTPLNDKINKISQFELDRLYVMKFDKQFASLPPLAFIDQYIVGMNVKHVVVGFDFTFGYKAEGNIRVLKEHAVTKGYQVTVVPKITFRNEKISSTFIRKLLKEGNVELIPYILGKHYELKVKLDKVAKGYYTITTTDKYMIPKSGEYVVSLETYGSRMQGKLIVTTKNDLILQVEELIHFDHEQRIALNSKLKVKETLLVSL